MTKNENTEPESARESRHDLEGELLDGRYRLNEVLARDPTGTVFRGHHIPMDRPVAIKVLRADYRTTDVLRFRREAEIAARLDHPNCVHVYEFGKTEHGMFIVMELLEGEPLEQTLDAPRTIDQVLHIGASVLEGLAHAHQLGLFHRDINPSRLYATPQADGTERITIVDFGLAKVSAADPSSAAQFTMTGVLDRDSRYCAPEHVLGLPVDARSDLFCVGMVLYRLLAGRVPYADEDHIDWLRQHIAKEIPKLAPQIPEPVAGVVYKLCRKERAQRYQSAKDALADFAVARRQCESEKRLHAIARGVVPAAAAESVPHAPVADAVEDRGRSWSLSRSLPRAARPWIAAALASIALALGIVAWTGSWARADEGDHTGVDAARRGSVGGLRADRILGIVNDPARAERLGYRKRHALIDELDPGRAPKVGVRLQTVLDLEQAAEAADPCAAFARALDSVERDPGPHYAGVLKQARVPGDAGCRGLDSRLALLNGAHQPEATDGTGATAGLGAERRRPAGPDRAGKRPHDKASKSRKTRSRASTGAPWSERSGVESEIKNPYQ